jgi:hypothetical protein
VEGLEASDRANGLGGVGLGLEASVEATDFEDSPNS